MTSDSEFNNSTVFVGTTPQGASQPAPRARLVCLDDTGDENLKDLEISLIQSEKMLGRSAENAICIPHKRLSRRHARLFLEGTTWTVEDLNSTNGVFVNEKKVSRAQLNDGDMVKFGPLPFRYELEGFTPVSDTTDSHGEASSPLGVEGTMYAGHAEVLASLAAAEKEAEPPEEPPTERPIPNKFIPGKEKRSSVRKPILRYLLILFIGFGLAGAGYLYVNHQRQQELNQLVRDYESRLQKFLEEYEVRSDASFQSTQAEEELEEIRTLKAGVDFAANQYPQSLVFKELQAKLLFLEFERRFQNLLLTEQQSIYDARVLVDKTRDEIGALLPKSASTAKSAIVEVLELLDLADVVVRFRQFSQRFNNFSDQVGDPFERDIAPTRAELREMQDLKAQFIEKKKTNRLPLSVTYTEFQSLLEEVEKQDIHFVDRLRGLMRRQQK